MDVRPVSEATTRFCASCGAANPVATVSCLACRQPLPADGRFGSLRGRIATAPASGGTGPLGSARTLVFATNGGRNRERDWTDEGSDAPPASAPPGAYGGHYEPPAYVIRQQAFDQPAAGPPSGGPPPSRRGSAAGGCLMGLIAFGVICALTAVLFGLVIGRPLLEDAVGEELGEAVATQIVRELDGTSAGATPLAAGTYVIDAAEINRELAADPDAYDPIENPVLTIAPDGLEISFEVYGLESSYRGMVEVQRGRLVLTDVEAEGAAARLISADEVRQIVERELNAYFERNDLTIERLELGDGTLTVVAVPTGAASPVATLEAAEEAGPTATAPARRTPTPGRAGPTPTPRAGSGGAPTPRQLDFFRTPTPAGR
jgi:hypothetical protein